MKKCNTQIMKEIKTLEEYRAKWINIERANCTVSYLQGEEPVLPDYDYDRRYDFSCWCTYRYSCDYNTARGLPCPPGLHAVHLWSGCHYSDDLPARRNSGRR